MLKKKPELSSTSYKRAFVILPVFEKLRRAIDDVVNNNSHVDFGQLSTIVVLIKFFNEHFQSYGLTRGVGFNCLQMEYKYMHKFVSK